MLAQEGGATLSVAALAREAGVGRNAIYVNHRDVIAELLEAAPHQIDATVASKEVPETDWRAVATELREQVRGLATENARLLRRAQDAELATARVEKRAAKREAQLRALQSPVYLYGTKPSTRNRLIKRPVHGERSCCACIQSAACCALLAAVKMARESSFNTLIHEAT